MLDVTNVIIAVQKLRQLLLVPFNANTIVMNNTNDYLPQDRFLSFLKRGEVMITPPKVRKLPLMGLT